MRAWGLERYRLQWRAISVNRHEDLVKITRLIGWPRGRMLKDLDADSEWFQGPEMLRQPFEDWNIRFGKTYDDPVLGEQRLLCHMLLSKVQHCWVMSASVPSERWCAWRPVLWELRKSIASEEAVPTAFNRKDWNMQRSSWSGRCRALDQGGAGHIGYDQWG